MTFTANQLKNIKELVTCAATQLLKDGYTIEQVMELRFFLGNEAIEFLRRKAAQ